jgi:hypothetical protein
MLDSHLQAKPHTMMLTNRLLLASLVILLVAACAPSREARTAGELRHGLDEVWRNPQVQWSEFRQVRLAPVEISFARDLTATATGTRIGAPRDGLERLRDQLGEMWTRQIAKALGERGYTLVDDAGPGVLEIAVVIDEVMLSPAFDDTPTPTRTFARQTARAQIRLSATMPDRIDQLLRVRDRAGSREEPDLRWRSAMEARADLDEVFARWARVTVRLLAD